jgi:AcrR family transcriptional regulator
MALIDIQPLSDRKREILNSARGLFSRKGFLAATMRDLAKELNIQPPSLYSHYDSKDEILWEIALRCANQFYEEVLPIAEEEASIADRMDRMIRQHASVILANQDAAAIFLLEWEHLAEPRRSKFAEITHYYQQAFVKLIKEGIDQGVFRPVKPKFTISMLLASIGWIHRWYRPDGDLTVEQIGNQLSDFLLAGLRKEEERGEVRRETINK